MAGAASAPSRSGAANRNEFTTEVFRLKATDAVSAAETLKPLISKEGSITANRSGNSLVVVDYADNMVRIRALIKQIDRDNATTQLITLDHAGAREIAVALQQLAPGRAGAEGGGQPLVSVVAIDSSNSIALRGDAPTIAKLAAIASQLDARAANGSEIRVIWLDYANAEQLVPVLQQLAGQASSASVLPSGGSANGSGAGSGSGVGQNGQAAVQNASIAVPQGSKGAIITRYADANAVIISAPLDVQRSLGELVRQLDIPQEQVLVEAIIVEISDRVAKEIGVQFLLGGEDIPFLVTPFSNVTPNILDIAGGLLANGFSETTTVVNGGITTTSTNSATSAFLQQNAANSVLGARGGYAGGAFDIGQNRFMGLLINAVEQDSESNILSTPSLTVNDNVKGSILFGQEIPISTGEALSNNFDNAFRTIQRQNVGIELEVTPQINAGNQVRLDLRQEVSSVAGPVSKDFQDLIINKREVKTTVTVQDREIVALGGLLDDNERRTIEKVPLLGDIPIIGELFKSRGRERVKTNLMVFIRPTILRNAADARALAARRYGFVREAQREYNGEKGGEPSIDALVREYMGALPPAPLPQGQAVQDVVMTPDGQQKAIEQKSAIQPVDIPPSNGKITPLPKSSLANDGGQP